jgi:hypothetical protein
VISDGTPAALGRQPELAAAVVPDSRSMRVAEEKDVALGKLGDSFVLRRVGVVHRHRHRVVTVHKFAAEGDVVDLNLA